jgi:hypothetical protein
MSTLFGQVLNRRREARSTVRARVYLTRVGEGMRRCIARDLSRTGAFIEVDPVGLRSGNLVQVVFALDLGGVTKLHRVSGVVARLSWDGVGVKF